MRVAASMWPRERSPPSMTRHSPGLTEALPEALPDPLANAPAGAARPRRMAKPSAAGSERIGERVGRARETVSRSGEAFPARQNAAWQPVFGISGRACLAARRASDHLSGVP